MPAKLTISQLSSDTEREVALLRKDLATLQKDVEQAKPQRLRDRITALEVTVAELKRTKEESERRRWQFAYIFVGAVCTLLVTIIVQLVLFWVRK